MSTTVDYVCVCCVIAKYRCSDGTALSPSARCNGRVECSDAADESNCSELSCSRDSYLSTCYQWSKGWAPTSSVVITGICRDSWSFLRDWGVGVEWICNPVCNEPVFLLNQYSVLFGWIMRLLAVDCVCIFGFWGLCSRSSPTQPPYLPIYATACYSAMTASDCELTGEGHC